LFGVGNDLRLNSFEERGDKPIQTILNDPLEALKSQSQDQGKKKLKDAFNGLIQSVWSQGEFQEGYTFNK
jgi:hypothetical protein